MGGWAVPVFNMSYNATYIVGMCLLGGHHLLAELRLCRVMLGNYQAGGMVKEPGQDGCPFNQPADC